MAEATDARTTRVHKTLAARSVQLALNYAVMHGGAEYIAQRLSRHPCETDTSWEGDQEIRGRKYRAYLINYAGRIITKINQYQFSQDVVRVGVDEAFAADVTGTGTTLNEFWKQASSLHSAHNWCWIGIDRAAAERNPATGEIVPRSQAAREMSGDKTRWTLYPAQAVVDWSYDPSGELLWLITEEVVYENADPNVVAVERTCRTLWERGQATRIWTDGENMGAEAPVGISAPVVPFVHVGALDPAPWWFDDVERIQAALLNLESAGHENLMQAVYPQLVIPSGLIEDVMRMSKQPENSEGLARAVEIVRGLQYPIIEGETGKGTTRYLQPSAQDLKAIPDDVSRLKLELYDVVGLAMNNRESKQVASADAKQWDHLDVAATLASRATILQDAERKCVVISKLLDTTFKEYEPKYSRKFDVSNPREDFAAILALDTSSLPDTARRETVRAATNTLGKIIEIDAETMAAIDTEINEMDISGGFTTAADRVATTPRPDETMPDPRLEM